mgnify:CR=1 FL=1
MRGDRAGQPGPGNGGVAVAARTGRQVEVFTDCRRVLDPKDIHATANAAPPHWHTKINVDACRAGKDVSTEKPLTCNVDEGKILRRDLP